MRAVVITLLAVLISACSADWHIRRAVYKSSPDRVLSLLERRYGGYISRKDTVIFDTIVLRMMAIDTMKVMGKVDTLVINRNSEVIKVIRHYDTIYVKAREVRDTIIKRIEVPKYQVVKEGGNTKLEVFMWLLIAIALLTSIVNIMYKGK